VADPDAPMYYLSIDARGELAFEENTFGYGGVPSHIVEVLTEQASNADKDFLRRKKTPCGFVIPLRQINGNEIYSKSNHVTFFTQFFYCNL